jgi:hypothetical protein
MVLKLWNNQRQVGGNTMHICMYESKFQCVCCVCVCECVCVCFTCNVRGRSKSCEVLCHGRIQFSYIGHTTYETGAHLAQAILQEHLLGQLTPGHFLAITVYIHI